MRTTLTLDDDVAAMLERVRESRKISLKELVNEALRQGLSSLRQPAKKRKLYRTQPVSLGNCLLGSLDDIAEALAVAEGERFR